MLQRRELLQAAALASIATTVTSREGHAADGAIWSADYKATKAPGVELAIYRKRVGPPDPAKPLPILFFVHGSSASAARPTT